MCEVKKLIDDLGNKAQFVANIKLESVIEDVDLLTVALCTSNLHEIARTLSYANEGDNSYVAAHRALDIGWNPSIRESLADKGYFAAGLRGLLELAERWSVLGCRLMPVFEEAVSLDKDLGIPKKLKSQLKSYINQKLDADGFAISHIDEDGKVSVKTARWIEEKVD